MHIYYNKLPSPETVMDELSERILKREVDYHKRILGKLSQELTEIKSAENSKLIEQALKRKEVLVNDLGTLVTKESASLSRLKFICTECEFSLSRIILNPHFATLVKQYQDLETEAKYLYSKKLPLVNQLKEFLHDLIIKDSMKRSDI